MNELLSWGSCDKRRVRFTGGYVYHKKDRVFANFWPHAAALAERNGGNVTIINVELRVVLVACMFIAEWNGRNVIVL